MPQPKPHQFNIRMSPELAEIMDSVRGKKSKNQIINEWLWSRARPDDAERLVDALRPILETLGPAERAEFVKRIAAALEILSAGLPKKRRPRKPSQTSRVE
jgi:hypothetical protein